jgi:hypothetical protein
MKKLTDNTIQLLHTTRSSDLGTLKNKISLKLFYAIQEKLNQEKQALEEILHKDSVKKQEASQYSFFLDPQYFEQKFIGA